VLAVCLEPTASAAHEFIVKPGATKVAADASLSVSAISTHVFMSSQELEQAKDVSVAAFIGGKKQDVPVKPNASALSYDGVITAPSSATFIVWGARLGQIWSLTPDGDRQATKKTLGASNSRKIEKFSKTLINLSPSDQGYATVVGDKLEIVPVTNPAIARVGDEITVKVLFKSQPLSVPVYATYDGFSTQENTYAYYTECADDGTAKIKITHTGLWMVRVEERAPEKTDDYDAYWARAVLVFEVK
jgi:uncharacterized GH25 family protein